MKTRPSGWLGAAPSGHAWCRPLDEPRLSGLTLELQFQGRQPPPQFRQLDRVLDDQYGQADGQPKDESGSQHPDHDPKRLDDSIHGPIESEALADSSADTLHQPIQGITEQVWIRFLGSQVIEAKFAPTVCDAAF